MTTNYQIGERVWYVTTCAYPVGQSKAVCYYRPHRVQICEVKIKQWVSWNRRLGQQRSVKYWCRFEPWADRRNVYNQQNTYIFRDKANALEYARLLNKLVKSYKIDDSNKTMAKAINKELEVVRAREPIEYHSILDD